METFQPVRVKRISILKVPIDIVPEKALEDTVREMFSDKGKHQLILINFAGLMKARRNVQLRRVLKEASLVIPVSKLIICGSVFLKKGKPIRYMPFEFIIRLLSILEKHHQSVYLLGSQTKSLHISENNLRISFPDLKIVGRHAGYYSKDREPDIITAIKKASPALLLSGKGLYRKSRWITNNKQNLNPGIYLWCGECFDIFSGKKKKPAKSTWDKGLEWFPDLIKKPWKIFQVFMFLYYLILLIVYRIRKL